MAGDGTQGVGSDSSPQASGGSEARILTRIVTPARLNRSPYRDRLEHGAKRKGYRLQWTREDGCGMKGLRLEAFDGHVRVQNVAISKFDAAFDEATVAERVSEWIFDPSLPDNGRRH